MKIVFAFLLITSVLSNLSAQEIKLYNASLIDTTKHELYDGIANELVITGHSKYNKYSVIVNEQDTLQLNEDRIDFYINYYGEKVDEYVLRIIDSKNNIIWEGQFLSRGIGSLELSIGDSIKSQYTVQDLIKYGRLEALIPNNNLKWLKFSVVSYEMVVEDGSSNYRLFEILPEGKIVTIVQTDPESLEELVITKLNKEDIVEYEFKNTKLSNEIIDQLKALPKGSTLYLTNIKVLGSDNKIRIMPSLTLVVE